MRGFESPEHQVHGADAEPRFTGGGLALIIPTVSTTTTQPGEGAFHDPTFRHEPEACGARRPPHHLQAPRAWRVDGAPPVERMLVRLAIGPHHCQARRGGGAEWCEHLRRGHRVSDGRTGDHDDPQQSQGIDTDMALASGDLLAAIIATLAASCGGLHRLAVNTGGTGGRRVRGCRLPADGRAPCVHYVLPSAVVAPRREVVIDRALGQQIMRGTDLVPPRGVGRTPPRRTPGAP